MSLTNQFVQKIRLILDKPPTPLNYKHVTELINKQVVPVEQLLTLIMQKYRSDLLLFMLQKFAVTAQQLEVVFISLLRNILKYQLGDLQKIWKVILYKENFKMSRQKWATRKIIDDAFKITNQTIKEMLFELLISNLDVLLQLNQTNIVQNFVKNYTANYLKYNIYLPPVPHLVTKCLAINSKAQIDFLSNQAKRRLLQRTLTLLSVTSQRKLFSYQNNCMSLVVQLFREEKQNIADMLDIYECEKVLQVYLYNKATRQQARKMQRMIQKCRLQISKQQKEKMEFNYQIKQSNQENIQSQTKQIPLIQNVIEKANDYHFRQKIKIDKEQMSISPSKSKNINFLKKGIGNGGGKAEISIYKSPSKIQKFSAVEQIIENCFYNNDYKVTLCCQSKQILYSGDNSLLNQSEGYAGGDKSKTDYQTSIEDGQEWTEISNLIDLAYEYKYG